VEVVLAEASISWDTAWMPDLSRVVSQIWATLNNIEGLAALGAVSTAWKISWSVARREVTFPAFRVKRDEDSRGYWYYIFVLWALLALFVGVGILAHLGVIHAGHKVM
jgi:hypothetical protein